MRCLRLPSLIVLAAGAVVAGCKLDLGDVPFYCNKGTPKCPDGYECKGQLCVRQGSCPEHLPECTSLPDCGNGRCDPDESPTTCPADCPPPVCKNGKCEVGETNQSCPEDCTIPTCGNSSCDAGETNQNCPGDCPFCGNGKCEAGETKTSCPADCGGGGPVCGNAKCETGESNASCPTDCPSASCPNGKCEPGESASTCPADCATSVCGNGKCEPGETPTGCPADCGGSCTADQSKCEGADMLKYCESGAWKSGTCASLCTQGGFDYSAGCEFSPVKSKDVCTCGNYGGFGAVCDAKQKCEPSLLCGSFTTGKGFCTKYCSVPNAKCAGAPLGTSATCILQISGKDVCGFECDGLFVNCPTGMKCDILGGVCKPS